MKRGVLIFAGLSLVMVPGGQGTGPEGGTLPEFLLWIVGGGGAAIVAYWLMERLPLSGLSSEVRRYVSLALSCALAWAAFGLSVVMSYSESPTTLQAWAEQLFAIAFVVVTGSQMLHGRLGLRKR